MLRGRFIAIQAYLKKQEKHQINNLTLHLKQLEKEEMKNLKVSRGKEILKIREEIHEKTVKNPTIWRLNNTLLNNQQIMERSQKGNKNMHRKK